jgi:integrase
MAKSTLRLDTRRALNDGTYPVQIVVGHGTNIYLSTGIYLTADDWDSKTKRCVGKGAKKTNDVLTTLLTMVGNRILELMESGQWRKLTRPQIKEMLTRLDLERPTIGVPSIYDLIQKTLDGRASGTKYIAKTAIIRLNKFCGDCTKLYCEQITPVWIDDYYTSLSDLAVNTRAAYVKVLRRAINYALDHDITTNNPFRHYRVKTEETRMRVLSIEKMRQLVSLETRYHYTEYRDMFLLSFYLIGINMADLSGLTADSIVNGRVEYRRAKTGKLYSIKIEPEAMAIIERYRGKEHLISCFDRCTNTKAYQGTLDNALARLGVPALDENGKPEKHKNGQLKMTPIDKKLSWYWARYSWATYAAELDIPKDTISEALGHSHGAKVTGIYIKYNRDKVDAANRKVIDYVLGKSENLNK